MTSCRSATTVSPCHNQNPVAAPLVLLTIIRSPARNPVANVARAGSLTHFRVPSRTPSFLADLVNRKSVTLAILSSDQTDQVLEDVCSEM